MINIPPSNLEEIEEEDLETRLEARLARWEASKTPEQIMLSLKVSEYCIAMGKLLRSDRETYVELQHEMGTLVSMGYLFDFVVDSYKRIREEYKLVKGDRVEHEEYKDMYEYKVYRGDKEIMCVDSRICSNISLSDREILDYLFKYEYEEGENEL